MGGVCAIPVKFRVCSCSKGEISNHGLLCLTKTLLLLVQSLYLQKCSVKQEGNKGGDGGKEQCLEGDTAKVKYEICGWRTKGVCRTLPECP
jgi:hypothetical protein